MKSYIDPIMIMLQEKRGQQNFVCDQTLPIKMSGDKPILEKWGIKFGSPVEGDNLFINVKLPDGWKKMPTSHSMWSDLLDDKGRIRAQIFYKAAYYDRDAFLGVRNRFVIEAVYDKEYNAIAYKAIDKSGDKELYKTRTLSFSEIRNESPDGSFKFLKELLFAEIKEVMNMNFPDWNDPVKSWEYPD